MLRVGAEEHVHCWIHVLEVPESEFSVQCPVIDNKDLFRVECADYVWLYLDLEVAVRADLQVASLW